MTSTFHRMIMIGMISLLICFGCNRPKEENEDSAGTDVRVPVKVTSLKQGNIEATVTAAGHTEALHKEKVLSPIAGRIISLKVLEGDGVHAGDVMVVLRTREAQATMEGAEALLRSATTDQQKREAQRARALADSLQPQILLKAAFDGVVASRNVAEGELVAEQTELLTIIDVSTIVFTADVPLNSISAIRPNCAAWIQFSQLSIGKVNAVVDAVSPQAESQSQSVKVRLRFHGLTANQRNLLKANVPGTAQIISGTHRNVFLVRRDALLHDDNTNAYSVVIMTKDSLAQVVPVSVGVQADSMVEIQSDLLHAGLNVITRGQYALTDSTRVTVDRQ